MGLEGHTKDATRSRILQGRDPRSIRVLIPDGRGPDQNIHDVTIADMGKLPEPCTHIGVGEVNSQMASGSDKPHDVATSGN